MKYTLDLVSPLTVICFFLFVKPFGESTFFFAGGSSSVFVISLFLSRAALRLQLSVAPDVRYDLL